MPDRPPGRESSSGPDANPDRHQETPPSPKREVVSKGSGRVCWRCGTPFAWTDAAALARCTELAQGAVEERTAAGVCPACAAGLAS